MATQEQFDELNRKYAILEDENRKAHKILNLISAHVPHLVFTKEEERLLYFTRIGGVFYLNTCRENNCMICGKDKKTTAHHLVPLRAKCKNKILRELRIRICKDCNKLVHPENAYLRSDKILQKKDRVIHNLKDRLKEAGLDNDATEH